jgi:ABC-type sugar transport system ATPase subunit
VHVLPCRVISGWAVSPLGRFRASPGVEGEAALCVRAREIEIGPPSFGTLARVTDVRFLGPEALVALAVQGIDRALSVRMRAAQAPAKGDEVGFHVDPDRVLVFPQSGAGTA